MTEEQKYQYFDRALGHLIGTIMTTPRSVLEEVMEEKVSDRLVEQFEEYMTQGDLVTECNCCGWWQNDHDGIHGDLCWRCAEDEEDFDLEDEA